MDGQHIFYLSGLGILAVVAVVAIPTISYYLYSFRIAEQQALLKQQMVDRGFTADEIVRVVRAGRPADEAAAPAHTGYPAPAHTGYPAPTRAG